MGNLIVQNRCLSCKNLGEKIEFGVCECDDYAKTLDASQIGMDEFLRRNGRLQEIKKPYRMVDVEKPLKRLLASAQRLAEESAVLASVSKSVCEKSKRQNRAIKVKKAKGRAKSSFSSMERSKAKVSWARRQSLKKAEDTVILGCIDGSIKSGEIKGWIEKQLRDVM